MPVSEQAKAAVDHLASAELSLLADGTVPVRPCFATMDSTDDIWPWQVCSSGRPKSVTYQISDLIIS
ncbi:hypothetical protein CORC01_10127 [Colletotrichum orchidophilum]|uniref:Uncharacterized protein n=1 Tax=Colletotrichum orchidophilum TaxID=1209926 RepID=A0A1G4AZJ6_9PEZI|nr:uncharacterized protein CORC01_10127 [Colletotrichum orchidophilum]OHE94599.1 hypothetical protein CORC01_10127 [Colletotrichum orchidophilum]